ncbi:MAG: tetratricopeptide repeat protein [Deltaproteobacteria bacterium]|jgi:tetratricopeptide (TPR) repeat protein|nr:tetratricopeptide repeat protein [Deltaproteobacteria bacterium]
MPEFVEAWSDLAAIYAQRKEYMRATAVYEHILEQDPANPSAWLRLIAAYLDAGDRQSALDVAKNAMYVAEKLAFAALGLFLEQKIYPEADTLLEHLRKQPDTPDEIHFYLAVAAYEGHKDIPQALQHLEDISPANRFYERSLRFRAQLLFENKQAAQALDMLRGAQKLFPDEASFFLMEAHMRNQEKQHAAALTVLDDLLVRQPDNQDAIYSRGMALDLIGRKDEAMDVMERLAADNPDCYQALNYIGYSLAEQRRELPRALTLLVKADQLSPDTAYILDSLAWAQFRLGQVDAAWASIQRAVKLEGGDDAVIWEHYGDIATAKGKPGESRRAYLKALDIGHDKPEAIRAKLEKL